MLPEFDYGYDCLPSDLHVYQYEFLRKQTGNAITVGKRFTLEIACLAFIDKISAVIKEFVTKTRVVGIAASSYVIYGGVDLRDPNVLVTVSRSHHTDITTVARSHYDLVVAGGREEVIAIARRLEDLFGGQRLAEVTWYFGDKSGRTQSVTILLDPPQPVRNEYYPWIKGGVDAYFDRYFESDASLLLMAGEPGTGKTSLLRHMLYGRGLGAMLTYDDHLLQHDGLFVQFFTDRDDHLFIIEDADTILSSREAAGNKMMSRFLNASDGLLKFPRKKIVFTTNLTDFRNVDPALLRPGRCFDLLKFRALTAEEASVAARLAGRPDPKRSCTLAELFNPDHEPPTHKVGF